MSIAVIDARGWQNTVDLRTGDKVDAPGPVIEIVREVLRGHPYPGDLDPGSNQWVTDTALDLVKRYDPRFVFLTYGAQYFSGRYTSMAKEARTAVILDVFQEIERFVTPTGFTAIVVGTGGMTPFLDFIDVTLLDGFAASTHWSTRYAGLHNPSPKDMEVLRAHPHIERIVPREEIRSLFEGTPEQVARVPEYLMLACEGYAFKTVSDAKRNPVRIPALSFAVPLYAPGHTVGAITGIRRVLEEELRERKTAFIVLEGLGLDDFLWPPQACRNGTDWFYYEPGEAQYLTMMSGRHRFLDHPSGSGYKYLNGPGEATRTYPFSGHFKSIPAGTFAHTFPGRSIAVGNKSMFMHMVTGTDLSIECFARNLYNQGTMAVVHREDKA